MAQCNVIHLKLCCKGTELLSANFVVCIQQGNISKYIMDLPPLAHMKGKLSWYGRKNISITIQPPGDLTNDLKNIPSSQQAIN